MIRETFFSVVITAFNKEKCIGQTINSVLKQQHKSFDLVIVNDGSTDNSLKEILKYNDHRIHVYDIENSGPSMSRNYGVKKAKNQFIAFLDGDDIWKPNHLGDLNFLIGKFPDAKWYTTGYETLRDMQHSHPMNSPAMTNKRNFGMFNYFEHSMSDSLVLTSAVCFRKTFFTSIGGFSKKIYTGQDIDLWIKAGIEYDVCFIKNISVIYNTFGENRITNMPLTDKTHMNLDSFLNIEINNSKLSRFINFYRYNHIIKFRLAGYEKQGEIYLKHLKWDDLRYTQRILLRLNPKALRLLYYFKMFLYNKGIRIRASKI